jgi:RNA polymerase sigma-70 factor (ECF subfamily)
LGDFPAVILLRYFIATQERTRVMITTYLHQLSDEQLVTIYQRDNNSAVLEVIYRRYFQKVFFYCRKIVGDQEEALDVSGDVFVKVFEKLGSLRAPASFQAWLFRIARNRCINVSVKKKRVNYLSEEQFHMFSAAQEEEQQEEAETQIVRMSDAFNALPLSAQNLLKEKYFNGDSIETLMARYHLSESAVKMRLARARGKANAYLYRA